MMEQKRTRLAMSVLGMLFLQGEVGRKQYTRPPNPFRKCLNGCGREHNHNNSFCSAECCREWKATHKGQGN